MNKEMELKVLLTQLATTMRNIDIRWTSDVEDAMTDTDKYPFHISFDELTASVGEWAYEVGNNLDKIIEYKKLALADMVSKRDKIEVNADNINELSNRMVYYEELHSAKYDAANVYFYLANCYIIENRHKFDNSISYTFTLQSSDYMCDTLFEAENLLLNEFLYGEYYDNPEMRNNLTIKKSINEFIDKI